MQSGARVGIARQRMSRLAGRIRASRSALSPMWWPFFQLCWREPVGCSAIVWPASSL